MVKYNLLQHYLWFRMKNYFLQPMILFSVNIFFLLQTDTTNTSEILFQVVDFRITQLLGAQ